MPDEEGNESVEKDETESTPLHAHAEDREEDMEGGEDIGSGQGRGAEDVENTGGATSGGPPGESRGEEDPSEV